MRRFCVEKGLGFQTYKALEWNVGLLGEEVVGDFAKEVGVSRCMALYLCVFGLKGSRVVNGCRGLEHMRKDVEGLMSFERWLRDAEAKISWTGWVYGEV